MKFYALKHKVHGLMPQAKTDRGYTSWPDQVLESSLGTPRLFLTEKSAVLSRAQWTKGIASYLVVKRSSYFDDFEDEGMTIKDVGRKKEDLEVVELFVGEALPPVEGNLLPELGEKVKIHLASSNEGLIMKWLASKFGKV